MVHMLSSFHVYCAPHVQSYSQHIQMLQLLEPHKNGTHFSLFLNQLKLVQS